MTAGHSLDDSLDDSPYDSLDDSLYDSLDDFAPDSRCPRRGDMIWADFEVTPASCAAVLDRRPALVVSGADYNRASGLALVCPITTKLTDYPFDVVLPWGCAMQGSVIADQVRSIDWRRRRATCVGAAPRATTREVLALLGAIVRA